MDADFVLGRLSVCIFSPYYNPPRQAHQMKFKATTEYFLYLHLSDDR
jgi:hypothetical protein